MPTTTKTTTTTARRRTRGNGEGSVYQDGATGRWVAQVKKDVHGKKRYTRSFHATEAQAKKKLRQMLESVDAGLPIADGAITVAQLLDHWVNEVLPGRDKPLSTRTIDVHRWACAVLTEDIGTKRLRNLKPDDVEAALRKRAAPQATAGTSGRGRGRSDAGLSRASLVKVRNTLSQALTWAEKRGTIPRNIARDVDLPGAARRAEPGRALTVEQARTLLTAAADDRLHALWVTMLMLGLRPGEATGLTWPDVDLPRAVIHVRRSLKLDGKRLYVDEQLKTSRSRRSLDAPPQVIEALRAHHVAQTAERLYAGPIWNNPEDLVFTTPSGTPINPSNLRRDFARLTERAGLGRWHPHELRHSAASILSAANVPLERIADQLGHDGTRMTMLVYRHAVTPTIGAAVAPMTDLFRNGA